MAETENIRPLANFIWSVANLEQLQEYRQSLITSAVTGKLDIQEVVSDHAC
jgi:hypothetical protein